MMNVKTRGNSNPQGKPRVYYTGHFSDVERHFDAITKMILKHANCAIYYNDPGEVCELDDLDRMQLVVFVVTRKFLFEENDAYRIVFQRAMEQHIPVLPIIEEQLNDGDLSKLNERLGDLQCLDPNSNNPTELNFDEKLSRFLEAVLIGDEMASKIRDAFDAYIFLSYRKKDRAYANELIKLIHSNDFTRDIAIWFDEFLVPGENFNEAIKAALDKSDLFALTVTPNLINEQNYVQTVEYPEAMAENKPILPVEMIETDKTRLTEQYENIPDCVNAKNQQEFTQALLQVLGEIVKRENNTDPQHNFFIGLAYLAGIDVEKNEELAEKMITYAAENGLPEAMKKLSEMYQTGNGVSKDLEKSVYWKKCLVETYYDLYNQNKCPENAYNLLEELNDLGNMYHLQHKLKDMYMAYMKLLEMTQKIMGEIVKSYIIVRFQIEALYGLAWYYQDTDCLDKALEYAMTAFSYSEYSLEHVHSEEGMRMAKNDYKVSAKQLSWAYMRMYDYKNAEKYAELSRRFDEEGAEELSASREPEELWTEGLSLLQLGQSKFYLGDIEQAELYTIKAEQIFRQLNAEIDNAEFKRNLGSCYMDKGKIYLVKKQYEKASDVYSECIEIFRELIKNSNDNELIRHLVEAYSKSIYVAIELNNYKYAMDMVDSYLAIAEYSVVTASGIETRKDLARCYEGIARLSNCMGDINKALEFQQMARSIYFAHFSDSKEFYPALDLAESDQRLWELFRKAEDKLQAIKYGLECIYVLRDFYEPKLEYCSKLLYSAYLFTAETYIELGKLEDSFYVYDDGCKHFSKLFLQTQNDAEGYRAYEFGFKSANILVKNNQREDAIAQYNVALSHAKRLKDKTANKHCQAQVYRNLGILTEGEIGIQYIYAALKIWYELMQEYPEEKIYGDLYNDLRSMLL